MSYIENLKSHQGRSDEAYSSLDIETLIMASGKLLEAGSLLEQVARGQHSVVV